MNLVSISLRRPFTIVVAIVAVALLLAGAASALPLLVYVGTYTGAKSKGIYAYRMDTTTGALTPLGLAAETKNPTFLAVHPNQRFLYAINEVGSGAEAGSVAAFAIDRDSAKLTLVNQQSAGGSGPCHLVVDRAGKNVLLANYGGGSVEVVPIRADGSLAEPSAFIQHKGTSANPERQEGPHAHCIQLDTANRFAVACDLGLDQVLVYRFDPAKGALTANDPPFAAVKPGAGPRHISFHPGGKFVYVINELDSSLTIFAYDAARGALKELQTVPTQPEPVKGNSTAEVEVHPSGRFVYGSNRGHNSIVVWSIDEKTGRVTLVEHQPTQGKTPRNFAIDPSGTFLLAANQDSDTVVVFRIDAKTGRLRPTGHTVEVGAPVCVKFVPATQP